MVWDKKVPFNEESGALVTDMSWWRISKFVWVDNFEFYGDLTYIGLIDHKFFEFQRADTSGRVFFTPTHLSRLLPYMRNGTVSGEFTFTKLGAHTFSCRLVSV